MSTEKNEKTPQTDIEDKNTVVISPEDCTECLRFFQFFEVPMAPELQGAFDSFIKEPTFEHQGELKYRLAEVISNSTHPVFQDEVFAQVRPETREVHEALAFERELEKQLTSSTADEKK